MWRSKIVHHLKKNRGLYYRTAPLLALALLVVGLATQTVHPFKSAEVAFTDAAPSGLSIVPASCASSPQTPDSGSCACGPAPSESSASLCPQGYTYDGSWCVVTGSACDTVTSNPITNPTVPPSPVTQYCPDGSAAPNNDTSQCPQYCSDGTLAPNNDPTQCPNIVNIITNGITCPDGTPAPNNDLSQCPQTPNVGTIYCADGTPAPNNDLSECPSDVTICSDGTAAPNNDLSQCPTTPPITDNIYCSNGSLAPNNDLSQCPGGGPGGNTPGSTGGICPQGKKCTACIPSASNVCANCPLGYTLQTNICVFVGCPSTYTEEKTANGTLECVKNECSAQYLCGGDGNLYYEDSSCDKPSLYKTCAWGCSGGQCSPPPAGDIVTFSVKPAVVQSGESTTISWTAKNVTSCTVSGSNGDGPWTGATGNGLSGKITGQTIYTINCIGDDGNAVPAQNQTVNIVPVFTEP